MDPRKHIYYITVRDVQTAAEETIGRKLHKNELEKVISKLLDKIHWYDPLEEVISDETI